MNPVNLQVHLRKIGVPPQRGRTSAIRQLSLQAPAPVIAKALGYHDKAATRLVTEAGGTWSRYAPRRPPTIDRAAPVSGRIKSARII